MDKVIKELKGHSGCRVLLVQNDSHIYVSKSGNVSRNVERQIALLNSGYPVPKIYNTSNGILDMEYFHGLDMKNYLTHNNINALLNFICQVIEQFSKNSIDKNYTEVYNSKLEWIPDTLPFTKQELINKLPKVLPMSMYHGDLTLENIIHTNEGFKLIDATNIEYDSYIFDIAKLRQDLECKWFLRNSDTRLDTKLQQLQYKIKEVYPQAFDDSLLILMLLRVLYHCEIEDYNYKFLMEQINKIWQNIN